MTEYKWSNHKQSRYTSYRRKKCAHQREHYEKWTIKNCYFFLSRWNNDIILAYISFSCVCPLTCLLCGDDHWRRCRFTCYHCTRLKLIADNEWKKKVKFDDNDGVCARKVAFPCIAYLLFTYSISRCITWKCVSSFVKMCIVIILEPFWFAYNVACRLRKRKHHLHVFAPLVTDGNQNKVYIIAWILASKVFGDV